MKGISKVLVLLCVVWVCYVGGMYAMAYFSAKPFAAYLEGSCPEIYLEVLPRPLVSNTVSRKEWVELIAWYDRKEGKELFTTSEAFRQYRAVSNCMKQRLDAFILKEKVAQGKITPELRIKYGYMLAIMFIPVALIMLVLVIPVELARGRSK